MTETARMELLSTAEDLAGLGSWSLDLVTMECRISDGMYRIRGLAPQSERSSPEWVLSFVHPDDRAQFDELLRRISDDPESLADQELDFDYRVVRRDGSLREIRARGRIDADASGGGRFVGVEQDITEQRMSERELRATYVITLAFREWQSFEEGVMRLLQRTATALEFPLASMWTQDSHTKEVLCRAIWMRPDLEDPELEAGMRTLRYTPGQGLPGRAWVAGRPMVTPDVGRDPNARQAEIVTEHGLTSGLWVPALVNGEPVAMLAYFTYERRDPSRRLIRTLATLGNDLGRFLSRRRGQLEASPLSKRELEVLGLAAEGLTGPQIAERLIVSPSTVKTHFENIYEKLGIGDRAGAVAYGLRTGLIA